MDALPLNALRVLAAVDREGGVRPAARALSVSHSAVSRHLAELERWLGVPVLARERGRRELGLTGAGRRLATATAGALGDLERVVAGIREQRSAYAVSISTTPSFAVRWLLPRLPRLERAHPRLEVSVRVEQAVESATAFDGDFAIRTGGGAWPGFDAHPLMDDLLFPVMGAREWEDAGRPHRVDALRSLRLLHDRDPRASWARWRDAHGPGSLDVRSGPRFSSSDLVLRAAARGLGVALAHGRLADEDLATGALVRPFGEAAIELGTLYWLVAPSTTAPTAAARTVMAWLRHEAG
jgi:LysR family glycine cleavage system transcriptional activator